MPRKKTTTKSRAKVTKKRTSKQAQPKKATKKSSALKVAAPKIKLPKFKLSISAGTLRFLKKLAIITIALLAIDGLLQLYYKNTIIAEADGYRVSKAAVVRQLLHSKMPTTATQIIQVELAKAVVFKEAKKQRISVSSEEINKQIEDLKKKYGGEKNFKEALASQGFDEKSFKELIKAQLLLKKLVEPQYKEPSEKELKDFFDKNKAQMPQYKDKKFEEVKDKIKEDYKNNKLAQLENEWMGEHLGNLQKTMVLYTDVPFKYTVGGGIVRLPVIREIAPVINKKLHEIANKFRKENKQETKQQQNQNNKKDNSQKQNEQNKK